MPRLWREFSMDVCWLAAEKCFREKWRRGDLRTFIEEWTGYSRGELLEDEAAHGRLSGEIKWNVLHEVACVVYDMVDGILHGKDPELDAVTVRPRRDGGTGKVRDIAMLCYRHQLLGHTVKIGMEKLLDARIEPTQHASMPERGQSGLARQVRRMLRRKLGIKYFQKMDGIHAYASVQYAKVAEIIRKEIPRGGWIHACMRALGAAAPGGHLIIGGYLDAWLFNFAMSYGVRYVLGLKKSRRGNESPLVIRVVTFMDDVVLMARSESGLKQAVRKLGEWLADMYCMGTRTTSGIVKLLSVAEERERKRRHGAGRGVAAIDAGGYRISRTHTTIRKRNMPRIARCFTRAWREYQETGTMKRQRCGQVLSRNGMIRNADCRMMTGKYHVTEMVRLARRIMGYWSRVAERRRKERIWDAVERYHRECAAGYCADGCA